MDWLSDYDYHLPDSAIAQEPLADRSASKLLWLHKGTGGIEHRAFTDVPDILRSGDLLVLNDTRVTARRLFGEKNTGGKVEALLLRELGDLRWEALVKPGKRLKAGARIKFESVSCEVESELGDGQRILRFDRDPQEVGQTPLPPYILKALTDPERYQTVYAQTGGSAAAPTAGLHFTPALLSTLRAKGIEIAHVTLDVGLDTFRPVQAENLDDHVMHGERCTVPEETARAVHECKGRIIAVGTTAVRTLESHALGKRQLRTGEDTTRIFIRPGYEFQIVDGMFTNFHMPRTTMLMMLSAITPREGILRAYAEALAEGYRFLSFGDSMLIL